MAGTMDKVKGAVKDAVGSATGNTRMQAEGKMDKAKGHAEDMADRVDKGAHKQRSRQGHQRQPQEVAQSRMEAPPAGGASMRGTGASSSER